VRAYALGKEINPEVGAPMSEDAKKVLFGQTAGVVKG
jgi:GST-like protein